MRLGLLVLLSACAPTNPTPDPVDEEAGPDAFADAVDSVFVGPTGGFNEDALPDIVLGPPEGSGAQAGSMDVFSLGEGGEIVLFFEEAIVDGDGPDLLVFENPFPGWLETGEVSVSADGETWHTFPCANDDEDGGFPGCAGVEPVLASSNNDLDPTDPTQAGGDAFDLADLGVTTARYVRIVDTGTNDYEGISGGFDLDAVAAVYSADPDDTAR